MFEVEVSQSFTAFHYLTVPDPGPEGALHSHEYTVTVRVGSRHLDEYQYVLDIDLLERIVDDIVAQYRDETLNDKPEFADVNPSLEYFATIIASHIIDSPELPHSRLSHVQVEIAEDNTASVIYTRDIQNGSG